MGKKNRRRSGPSTRVNNIVQPGSEITKPKSKERSANELISLAEAEMADPVKQIAMYNTAARRLRSSGVAQSNPEKVASVLGRCAECKAGIGDLEGGATMFLEGIKIMEQAASSSSTLSLADGVMLSGFYFYLGQLCTAGDSLKYYQDGIQILERCCNNAEIQSQLNSGSDGKTFVEGQKQLCSAYCSIAELYMTDLCYEDNAEAQCELFIRKAVQLNADKMLDLADPLQAMANLLLCQSKTKEATEYIARAYQTMKVGCESLSKIVGLGVQLESEDLKPDVVAPELSNVDQATSLPGFEFRVQTAKIILECISHQATPCCQTDLQQLSNAAVHVLGSLLAENDEVIEVWYLTGCAFHSRVASSKEAEKEITAAKYYWKKALDMLKAVKNSGGVDDEEVLNGQIEEVMDKLSKCSSSTSANNDNAMEEG